VEDPAYLEGLKAAVRAAVDYGISGIQDSSRNPSRIPPALLVQARVAARNHVDLDIVLCRYIAGNAVFLDFIIEEVREVVSAQGLKRTLRSHASLLERLTVEVIEEHRREQRLEGRRLDTSESRKRDLVRRLLDGERIDATELGYELEGTHVGVVGKGPDLGNLLRELALRLGCRLLTVCPAEEAAWGWLQGEIDLAEMERHTDAILPPRSSLAVGEPASGMLGWRLSHRQALAALPIALSRTASFVRYREVMLLSAIIHDDLLVSWLRESYLEAFEREPDGGDLTRRALQAYFASGRNVSSAAAALGVHRNTITKRIRVVEETAGKPFVDCAIECEMALKLDELEQRSTDASLRTGN
jgi:PucR C-terminal helix-turn-helix domain/GGDEF-like domain